MNPIRKAMETLPGNWHQGGMFSIDRTKACGWGHLLMANDENVHNGGENCLATLFALTDAIAKEQYPDRTDSRFNVNFPVFNDHPNTTEDEVLRVLDKAAVEFESRI